MRDRGDGICRIPSDSSHRTRQWETERNRRPRTERVRLVPNVALYFVVLSSFDALHAILGPIYLVFIRARGPHYIDVSLLRRNPMVFLGVAIFISSKMFATKAYYLVATSSLLRSICSHQATKRCLKVLRVSN